MASIVTKYELAHLAINLFILSISVVPKIPEMHRVRILGINSTVGIDDAVAKSKRGFIRRLHSE